MPRYLVIEFADNGEADIFREKVDKLTSEGKRFRVAGMFAVPHLMRCQCARVSVGVYKIPKPRRGMKFGWWLCGNCGKPRAGGHDLVNLLNPKELFGRTSRFTKGVLPVEERSIPDNYEWQIKGLTIAELPINNIGRKKKRGVKW